MTALLTTPLHRFHLEHGAKMVPFAGWEMPVQYPTGVLAEHRHTRASASMFDVSHMGQVIVRGETIQAAAQALETVTPASVAGLRPWRQRYGMFTNSSGGILDDFMVANHEQYWFVVVNAACTEQDLGILRSVAGIEVEHLTDRTLLAVQGPKAEGVVETLIPGAAAMVFMDSTKLTWDGTEVWVSRSGYTGEDGYEISLPADRAEEFATLLTRDGTVKPAGLGARDSLRLEAGMPLYGHDLSETITPAQAALGWAIPKVRRIGGSREGGYPGADVIGPELVDGPPRMRVGLRPAGRAPIREGVELFADDTSTEVLGIVTSGGFGPTVGGPIAMAMLPSAAEPGHTVYAALRGKRIPVNVTDLPFITPHYKR